MATANRQSRIIGLDICRSAAIATVMLSHSITESGLYDHYFPDHGFFLLVRFLIQMAPPIFIILFGSMLEIIYRPRVEAGEGREVTARLLTRALQCYLLYFVSLLALLAAGIYSFGYTLRCALLIGITPYTDILKFYALALAIAPGLLYLRRKIGLPALAILALGVHAAFPVLSPIILPDSSAFADFGNPLIGFLIGGDQNYVGGPSFLHGLTLVIWGMMFGRIILGLTNEGASRRDILNAIGMLLLMYGVSLSALIVFWHLDAPIDTTRELADMTLRNQNHPIYFAYGMVSAMTAALAAIILYDANGLRFGRSIAFAGQTSLFTFSFGNILLYIAPVLGLSAPLAWAYATGLFLAICAQSYAFYLVQFGGADPPGQLVARARQSLLRLNEAVGRLPRRIAPRYAGLLGW